MVEPIVSARRGVPVTVTVSDKGAVKVSDWPGMYVVFDGPVKPAEIVGAVRSMVMGVLVWELADGPFVLVAVPNTELAST